MDSKPVGLLSWINYVKLCLKTKFDPKSIQGSPGGTDLKDLPDSAGNTRDTGLIPGSGRSPGVGNSSPLQYSCLENSMDRGTWQATILGLKKVRHDWASKHKHKSI